MTFTQNLLIGQVHTLIAISLEWKHPVRTFKDLS